MGGEWWSATTISYSSDDADDIHRTEATHTRHTQTKLPALPYTHCTSSCFALKTCCSKSESLSITCTGLPSVRACLHPYCDMQGTSSNNRNGGNASEASRDASRR
mmetsp:Transcript_35132/g.109793  ORF Transcript_35132/g.109793 Transcript_35132/m.109793 type:complete len:105 (+) Transcript_35132:1001-1315(+)